MPYIAIGVLVFFLLPDWRHFQQIEKALSSQIEGKHCLYKNDRFAKRILASDYFKTCGFRNRSFFEKIGIQKYPIDFYGIYGDDFDGRYAYMCKVWAAKCMAISKDSGYQEVLIRGLLSERDIFDGDSLIPVQIEIVKALGEVGTGDAIIFLESYMGSGPEPRSAYSGDYFLNDYEPIEVAQEAIVKIKAREAASSKQRTNNSE